MVKLNLESIIIEFFGKIFRRHCVLVSSKTCLEVGYFEGTMQPSGGGPSCLILEKHGSLQLNFCIIPNTYPVILTSIIFRLAEVSNS